MSSWASSRSTTRPTSRRRPSRGASLSAARAKAHRLCPSAPLIVSGPPLEGPIPLDRVSRLAPSLRIEWSAGRRPCTRARDLVPPYISVARVMRGRSGRRRQIPATHQSPSYQRLPSALERLPAASADLRLADHVATVVSGKEDRIAAASAPHQIVAARRRPEGMIVRSVRHPAVPRPPRGDWLSRLERAVHIREVTGSNPVSPTTPPARAGISARRGYCRTARLGRENRSLQPAITRVGPRAHRSRDRP